MNIFVGSLSFKTTEEELQREFEAFGEVDTVKIILDKETLRSRGFGFVTMSDREQALAAIAGMDGKLVNGFTLKVNEAKPREARSGPPRSGGGYNSDRSGSGFGYNRPSSGGGGGGYSRPSGGGGGGYNRPSGGGGGGYNSDRGGNSTGSDIYDSKDGRSGGGNRKGRGGSGGHGSGGGRSGGGRRSY